jgi:hypothetical protein
LAAADLAEHGQRVIIVTGFFIPAATPPAAETDGPPGAALLAAALTELGLTVQLVTDDRCRSAVEVATREMGLLADCVVVPGRSSEEIDDWFRRTANDQELPPLTHLIAIERVGPSHTLASIPQPDRVEFERLVPAAERDHAFNMRGVCLDEVTAPLHRLFELAIDLQGLKTIGIGDGGNEIGMGAIPWSELHVRLTNPDLGKICCRVPTDWTIVAGVSNWGGMALAAAVLMLRGKSSALRPWTATQQQALLQRLVAEGPAVDGVTRLPEATVDGLPFLTYIQPWEGIRRVADV